MVRAFTSLLLGALCVGHANAGVCDKGPKDFFLFDTVPQAKAAGVEYASELSAAFRKDKGALGTLLNLTAGGTLDGAGAQTHAEVLWALLQCWGDDPFAEVLGRLPTSVRGRVLTKLRYATEETKSSRTPYPKTFRASTSKTSNFKSNGPRTAAVD